AELDLLNDVALRVCERDRVAAVVERQAAARSREDQMRFGGVAKAAARPAAAENDDDFKRRHDRPRREDVTDSIRVRKLEPRNVYGLRGAVEDFDELVLRRAARAVAVGVADQIAGRRARRV